MKYGPYNTPWLYFILSGTLGFLIALFLSSPPKSDFYTNFITFQPLLAGTFAIGAAAIGWAAVRSSDENKRLRQARAAKALMPIHLTIIYGYAKSCASVCVMAAPIMNKLDADDDFDFSHEEWSIFSLPELPNNTLKQLQAYVEYADIEAADSVLEMLRALQIQYSRFQEHFLNLKAPIQHGKLKIVSLNNILGSLYDAAELMAWSNSLISIVRDQGGSITRPTANEIQDAIDPSFINPKWVPGFTQFMDRKSKNAVPSL